MSKFKKPDNMQCFVIIRSFIFMAWLAFAAYCLLALGYVGSERRDLERAKLSRPKSA